ncbi:MAG: hypothetical protein ABID61_00690 [Candidatus Micrarchaeota archaeon]
MRTLRRSEVRKLASERLKVIKPLCEEALGRRINGDITIRVHTRFVSSFLANVWYPTKKALFPKPDSFSDDVLSRALTPFAAPFLFAARGLAGILSSEFRPMAGYAVTGENVILLISSSSVLSRAKELDYFLAHELTHLLTDDAEQIPGSFGLAIYEGLATYYGEKVAQRLYPDLNVLDTIEKRPIYVNGYLLMRAIEEKTGRDPLQVLMSLPHDSFDEPTIFLKNLFVYT